MEATVVDVAGRCGQVSIALMKRRPLFRFVFQDRPETVSDGSSKLPAELIGRVAFMAHDFFTKQPIKGADVFLLCWILHDWSDKYAIKS